MVYLGAKTKYAKYIVPILQQELDSGKYKVFIDVCCGGCNIIDKINFPVRLAIDKNLYLIGLFKYGIAGGELPSEISREIYYNRKFNLNQEPLWMTGTCEFFCSYNGQGFWCSYAVSESNGRNRYAERVKNFQKQLPMLKDVNFLCMDINKLQVKDCLIYVDPPYKTTHQYDFFMDFNHETFWDSIRRLSKKNTVYVSEQQAPEDFDIVWSIDVTRNIRGRHLDVKECLFKWKG